MILLLLIFIILFLIIKVTLEFEGYKSGRLKYLGTSKSDTTGL